MFVASRLALSSFLNVLQNNELMHVFRSAASSHVQAILCIILYKHSLLRSGQPYEIYNQVIHETQKSLTTSDESFAFMQGLANLVANYT